MFDKASNVMILSKKTPRLDQFVEFGFWAKGERESESAEWGELLMLLIYIARVQTLKSELVFGF
jgi:hypothetical protein